MSANTLKAIAIALLLLISVWLLARLVSRPSDVVSSRFTLPSVKAQEVDSVILRHDTNTVRLVRSGTTWTVNGFRAGTEPIGQFFLAFRDTGTPELAAVSTSSFQRMGVDSSHGHWLELWSAGKPPLRLILGTQGDHPSTGYIRKVGSDSVILWRGTLIDQARRAVPEWRDKRIASVAPESVLTVSVTARRPYVLRRSGPSWKFANGAAADSGKVAQFLATYRQFNASGFGTAAQADSGRKPAARRTLTLTGVSGAKLLELTFDSSSTGIWARRTGEDNVYRVDAWRLNSFVPPDSALRPVAPAKPTSPARH
jgi:hypothetical protein